ncbi:hypothetical protein BRADI_5g06892v3 [Brachypodium distachyon]|uniref:Uncharacterized protein n=1 Tax=Brachypodium distachyon TaxID=15368 RepID=A0A2K2CFP7_BRADI|nr:hypothetical protein BRADI_5g06892v3 [Brachypodium distachyon]
MLLLLNGRLRLPFGFCLMDVYDYRSAANKQSFAQPLTTAACNSTQASNKQTAGDPSLRPKFKQTRVSGSPLRYAVVQLCSLCAVLPFLGSPCRLRAPTRLLLPDLDAAASSDAAPTAPPLPGLGRSRIVGSPRSWCAGAAPDLRNTRRDGRAGERGGERAVGGAAEDPSFCGPSSSRAPPAATSRARPALSSPASAVAVSLILGSGAFLRLAGRRDRRRGERRGGARGQGGSRRGRHRAHLGTADLPGSVTRISRTR